MGKIFLISTLVVLLFFNKAESGVSVKFYTEADCDNIRVTLGGHLNQYTLNCGKWIGFDVNTPGVWPTVVEGCGGRYELYVETWRDVEIIICPHHLNMTDCCSRGVDPLGQFHCNECPEPECEEDIDCDDGLFCNGEELCLDRLCFQSYEDPCPPSLMCDEENVACVECLDDNDCVDGLFCNGDETCDEADNICLHSGNPCTLDLFCDESNASCVECIYDNHCSDGLYCNGEEACVDNVCQYAKKPCIDDELFCNGEESCDEDNDICLHSGNPCEEWQECDEEKDRCYMPMPCVATAIYGEYSEDTEHLRYFRDDVLSQTSEGQELIRLYYQWSPAIVKAMEEDEGFKEEVKEMIDGVLMLLAEGTE